MNTYYLSLQNEGKVNCNPIFKEHKKMMEEAVNTRRKGVLDKAYKKVKLMKKGSELAEKDI